jgi:hypothetical protein
VVDAMTARQKHKPATNYMTHPIHLSAAVCFHLGGVGVNVSRIDGVSTSIGAARPRGAAFQAGDAVPRRG